LAPYLHSLPTRRSSDLKPKPASPAFPLPKGHWYGVESSNPKNHSGYHAKDRAGIRQLQQGLRDRGWKISVDGLYGPSTRNIVTRDRQSTRLNSSHVSSS